MTGDRDDLGIEGLGPGVMIGHGGSAVVYRSRQEELDRDVAVKVLGGVGDEDTRRRFDRERRLMGRLSQHEGMVTVYQTGFTTSNEPFIVMPLLGRSLADVIKQQPVSWERAAEIIVDVCRTVGFAHDQGIVHRDLKPGNIMMSTGDRPLVADFGIARIVDSRTNLEATALTLTPAYSSPEALETTIAERTTDVYSLGATLFALIAGHPPYCPPGQDQTLMTLMRCIIDDPAPQLGAVAPPEIQAVLDRSMAKLAEHRYQTASEMADALESAAAAAAAAAGARAADRGGNTVVVAPTTDGADGADSLEAKPTEPTRRRGLIAIAVVAALFVAGAGILVAQAGWNDDEVDTASAGADAAPLSARDEVGDEQAADEEVANADETNGDDAISEAVEPAPPTVVPDDTVLVVEGGEVFLLPFDEPGVGAFTSSFAAISTDALSVFVEAGGVDDSTEATGDDPDQPADQPADPSTAVTGIVGTSEGVFAGTEGVAPCAPDDLIAGLDPAAPEAVAWAAVQGIDVESVPTFVDGLTATVLTADTRVTDHRFIEGETVPSQAVLQVGTGVLIDEFGEPQVRCASGSPLAPPEAVEGTTRYIGSSWDTFEPARTVAVVAAPDPVAEFVLTDVAGGIDFIRPVGSSGAADRPLLPGEILAVGGVTGFPDVDPASFTVNEVTITFRPEGGDVNGTFAWTIPIEGIVLELAGDLVGTYDPVANTMSGTAIGTTIAGDGTTIVSGSDDGFEWSATVDPTAGTISGNLGGEAPFELTFTPFVR